MFHHSKVCIKYKANNSKHFTLCILIRVLSGDYQGGSEC